MEVGKALEGEHLLSLLDLAEVAGDEGVEAAHRRFAVEDPVGRPLPGQVGPPVGQVLDGEVAVDGLGAETRRVGEALR